MTTLYTPAGEYYGSDTLEGFAKDAELLGKFVKALNTTMSSTGCVSKTISTYSILKMKTA
jgi:hypothetical protein